MLAARLHSGLKQRGRPTREHLLRESFSEAPRRHWRQLRIERVLNRLGKLARAIGTEQDRANREFRCRRRNRRSHSDRRGARRADSGQERTLRRGLIECAPVVKSLERTIYFTRTACAPIGERFYREPTLRAGWNKIARVELDKLYIRIADAAEAFQ